MGKGMVVVTESSVGFSAYGVRQIGVLTESLTGTCWAA